MTVNKTAVLSRRLAALLAVLQAFVWRVAYAAQEPDIKVDITSDSGPAWYANWWVWVLIALFVIVIIAITNRGGRERPT